MVEIKISEERFCCCISISNKFVRITDDAKGEMPSLNKMINCASFCRNFENISLSIFSQAVKINFSNIL